MFTGKQTSQAENKTGGINGKTPFFNSLVQTKLQINEPGDSYEHEADAMADHVMRMNQPSDDHISFFKPAANTLHRKCQHCEEEEKLVRRKENSGAQPDSAKQLDSYVSSQDSSGTTLPESSRIFFEPRFERDLSGVRVHTDQAAAQSAQSINALAYTAGNNIVFNSGQYAPESDSGKKLIAHELTHVLQQNPHQIQRKAGDKPKECANYEKGEFDQSHSDAGVLAEDVVETADGLLIRDFGVETRHPNDPTLKNKILLKMLQAFEDDPTYTDFVISGYTDCVGSEGNNVYLRQQRAKNVYDLFGKKAKARVTSHTDAPAGEYIAANTTKDGRATNRSALIKFKKPPPAPKCKYSINDALKIETAAARETLDLSGRVASSFTGFVGGLDAHGRFTHSIFNNKYWFSKLYEIITYDEINDRMKFTYPAFVMHFIPIFYNMYNSALQNYLNGKQDQISAKWLAHFKTTDKHDRDGGVMAWMDEVQSSIITGVKAHIQGDMAAALEEAFRSYEAKYCLSDSFDIYKDDFFRVNKQIFLRVKGDFFLELAHNSASPLSPELTQYLFAEGEGLVGGLSVDEVYSWRADAWQKALDDLKANP